MIDKLHFIPGFPSPNRDRRSTTLFTEEADTEDPPGKNAL
jgi:hypothetical protein